MIDTKKAKQLGCTSTCSVSLRVCDVVSMHELPSTPHRAGLCVVLIVANEKLVLRVTHVRSSFALGLDYGDYPATKVGMAAALYEHELLLPITDWTRSADDLKDIEVEIDAIVQRCRRAFPGKLVGNVVARDVAEPPPEIVKWRVYSQDTATGGWSFVDLAHVDHLLSAVDEALTKTGKPSDVPTLRIALRIAKRNAFDFDNVLHTCTTVDGMRVVVVESSPLGFDLCCEQLVGLHDDLDAARDALGKLDNPRRGLGVWKSGSKFGQLKLSTKLSPEQCVELLAQQDRYDAQARKVEQLADDIRELELHFAESEPIPERVTKLCPRETPDGKDEVVKLLGLVRTTAMRLGSPGRFMFGKCIAQLEKNLREYESVELHGFAPGVQCILLPDPNERGAHWRLVEVEDVHVSRVRGWSSDQHTWEHERDVIELYGTGQRFTVNVRCLKVAS